MEIGRTIRLMLCGDVMTGRGIDQVLPNPGAPQLDEPAVKSAIDYVRLAERANGPIRRPVSFDYIWGDALAVLARWRPDVRVINLETAVTRSGRRWPKGINYRMSPENVPCLAAANIDACVLSNNHVLDWGREGLAETLDVLQGIGLETAGAGRNLAEATRPAILPVPGKGRVLVYGVAQPSSGVPRGWAAAESQSGVSFLAEPSPAAVDEIAERVRGDKRPGDIAICSIHWGPNWGYGIPVSDRAFAHALIDRADVDVVHGHSSHHPKAIEVHHGKPIFFGCGDVLNDYEGIEGHEPYRDDLTLIYLVDIAAVAGRLVGLSMIPFRIRNFRLNRADDGETEWLRQTMDRECGRFGTGVGIEGGALSLAGH